MLKEPSPLEQMTRAMNGGTVARPAMQNTACRAERTSRRDNIFDHERARYATRPLWSLNIHLADTAAVVLSGQTHPYFRETLVTLFQRKHPPV